MSRMSRRGAPRSATPVSGSGERSLVVTSVADIVPERAPWPHYPHCPHCHRRIVTRHRQLVDVFDGKTCPWCHQSLTEEHSE